MQKVRFSEELDPFYRKAAGKMSRKFKKKTSKEYVLNRGAVDEISRFMDDWFRAVKLSSANAVRCRMAMETLLIKLCEHYDGKLPVLFTSGRRLGRYYISVRYQGESFDPMQEEVKDQWTHHILSNVGLAPVWSYRQGVNELILKLPQDNIPTELLMLGAFATALLLGFLSPAIPDTVKGFLNENVFKFVSGIFLNLMGTFAGILVFLSVISGICGMGNLSDFTKMGKYMVKRFIVFSFVGGATCGLIMIPFFSFQFGATTGKDQASAILNLLKDIIPSNPITPFQDGNMLQIVIMAVIVGGIILLMSREVDGIRDLIFQTNSISLRLMESICKLLPIFIISSLTSMFWENGMGIFATIWKPLVFIVASCYGLMIIKLIVTSVRCKVPALLLFKKVLPGFVIGFTTASSTAALGTVFDINSKKLGIMDNINRFGVPVSNIVCNSATSASFIAIIYYLTEYSGNPVDASWFLSAWFIVTLMAFAMPPVSGGTLVVLGVLFAQFGLPSSTLGLAGILALLADFISTSSKIVIGQMELVLEAAHWKALDVDILRGDI